MKTLMRFQKACACDGGSTPPAFDLGGIEDYELTLCEYDVVPPCCYVCGAKWNDVTDVDAIS